LLVMPIFVLATATLLPGVRQRVMTGFGAIQGNIVIRRDPYEITAGRTVIWPYVIERIGQAPFVGYGRQAMQRTGLSRFLLEELGEGFPHPHNMFLELLLDNGIIGVLLVFPFYGLVLARGFSLFRDRTDSLCVATGGVACAIVLSLLAAGIGSQTFYPREGAVGMWATFGILFRVYEERQRARAEGRALFAETSDEASPAVSPAALAPVPA